MARLELTFTGLCVLVFKGEERLLSYDEVAVLLVDSSDANLQDQDMHQHFPRLAFRGRDYDRGVPSSLGMQKVCVAPSGEDIAHLDLAGDVEIEIPDQAATSFTASWAPDSDPSTAVDHPSALNWTPRVERLNVSQPDANHAAAHVTRLPFGAFSARRMVWDKKVAQRTAIAWEFQDGGNDQAIADHVVLSAELPAAGQVKIKLGNAEHWLKLDSDDEVLPISITNLPAMADISGPGDPRALEHLKWYGTLAGPDSFNGALAPRFIGASRTRGSIICPSTRTHV